MSCISCDILASCVFTFPHQKYKDTESVNKQNEGNTKALRERVLGVSTLKEDSDGTRTESPSSRRFSVGKHKQNRLFEYKHVHI